MEKDGFYLDPEDTETYFPKVFPHHKPKISYTGRKTLIPNYDNEGNDSSNCSWDDSSDSIRNLQKQLEEHVTLENPGRHCQIPMDVYNNLSAITEASENTPTLSKVLNSSISREFVSSDEKLDTPPETEDIFDTDPVSLMKDLTSGYNFSLMDLDGREAVNIEASRDSDFQPFETPQKADGCFSKGITQKDGNESFWSCDTPLFSTPIFKKTPLKPLQTINFNNISYLPKSERKNPTQPIVSVKKQSLSASKIPVLKRPTNTLKSAKSLQFSPIVAVENDNLFRKPLSAKSTKNKENAHYIFA